MTADLNYKKNTVTSGSDTYSVGEIANILGISKKSAYKLCEKEYFITKRIGRAIRINRKSFDLWFNSNP